MDWYLYLSLEEESGVRRILRFEDRLTNKSTYHQTLGDWPEEGWESKSLKPPKPIPTSVTTDLTAAS